LSAVLSIGVLPFVLIAPVVIPTAAQEKPQVAQDTQKEAGPSALRPDSQNPVIGKWEGEWVVHGGVHSGKRGTILLIITSAQDGKIKGSLTLTGLAHSVDGPITGDLKADQLTVHRWPLPHGTLTFYLTVKANTAEGSFSYGTMSNHIVTLKRLQ
jgi:hypothetical protein